jgi:hypothetical protein
MKRIRPIGIAAVLVILIAFASVSSADVMTFSGKINDDYILVSDDGEDYLVNESEKGDELLGHVGKRVKVTGDVQKSEDGSTIEVQDFQLLSE